MSTADQPLIAIIVAMTAERIIGRAGSLPWSIPEDLQLFRKQTLGGTLIMGRRTFDSLPGPLADRHNLVVSSTLPPKPGIKVCRSWPVARQKAILLGRPIWVIGGAELYREALADVDLLSISWVHDAHPGEINFPPLWQRDWELLSQEDYQKFTHCRYCRREQKNSPEAIAPPGLLVSPVGIPHQ
jgi:dihydrofolate reductase